MGGARRKPLFCEMTRAEIEIRLQQIVEEIQFLEGSATIANTDVAAAHYTRIAALREELRELEDRLTRTEHGDSVEG